MITLRLFDPGRTPASWTEIIRPGQYAAFAKTIDTGAPCDAEGQPFPTIEDATCWLFDSLAEAETFCRQQAERVSDVRFEIFDSTGRASPPLLLIVHPARMGRLEGNPGGVRRRNWIIAILVVIAAASFWHDFIDAQSLHFFPTLLGINLVVVAARLLQLNRSYASAERVRKERLAEHRARTGGNH